MSKMGYVLRDRSDGSVELVETRPTVIATFANRPIAELMFAAFIKAKPADHALHPTPTGAETVAQGELSKALPLPIAPVANAVPTEADWSDAFQAIVTGGDMNDIAQMLGVTMPQLRGKYAAWRKVQKSAASDVLPERLRAAVSSMMTKPDVDKDACRLCGKEFTASISTDGCCARCAR